MYVFVGWSSHFNIFLAYLWPVPAVVKINNVEITTRYHYLIGDAFHISIDYFRLDWCYYHLCVNLSYSIIYASSSTGAKYYYILTEIKAETCWLMLIVIFFYTRFASKCHLVWTKNALKFSLAFRYQLITSIFESFQVCMIEGLYGLNFM